MVVDDHTALHVGLAWAEATLDVCDKAAREMRYATSRKKIDPELDDALFDAATKAMSDCYVRRAEKANGVPMPPLVGPPFEQDEAQ
jgi:hypothetical protein